MRSQKALLALAAIVGLAASAFAAPVITMTDTVGDPNSATVAPGGTFTVNLAVNADVGTTGITYFLKADRGGDVSLTLRTIVGPFTDPTTASPSYPITLTTSASAQDLGAGKSDVSTNEPAGTIAVATLTFSLSPTASGTYTISTINSAMTDADFNDIVPVEATYTVAVPEPTSLGAIIVGGMLLGRRRR